MMRWGLGLAAAVVFAVISASAQGAMSDDERQIRDQIEKLASAGVDLRTADSIFFSGAYVRPFVRGQNESELLTALARTIVPGSSTNDIRIRRIEVASGGDLAYEFSDGTLTRRLKRPDGSEEPATLENSTLRVWKKVDGRWLVAAHFSARHGARQ